MKLSEFDFRVWNNNSKTYEAGSIIESLGFITSVFNQLTYEKPTIDYEIELFTGFYDKNGKKIFEGDILENKEFEEFYLITRNDIVYNILEIAIYRKNIKGQLYKYKKNADISFFKSIPSSKYMEIIGNINVMKNLLEETNESKS
ncbi:putative YopX protein [Campylobacter phage F336]|uniref:Putative YopX protein n=1 Tax=Campylobacter phage F336 TaxID=2794361 RepID=A0A7T3KD31_9CAUD|nr:putative YopX protein [Campylobacter phage F336]